MFAYLLINIKIFLAIFSSWLLLLGFKVSHESLILGCLVSLFTTFVLNKLNVLKGVVFKISIQKYIIVLFTEIFKSTIYVTKLVFQNKIINLDSKLTNLHIDTDISDTEAIMIANFITMTPGTIVISTANGDFLIHSIDKSNTPNIQQIKQMILK
jgi:multisubunit Na+/H+ antiporter MnhE subunit